MDHAISIDSWESAIELYRPHMLHMAEQLVSMLSPGTKEDFLQNTKLLEDPCAIIELSSGEERLALVHDATVPPYSVVVMEYRFGNVPDSLRATVYEALLRQNHLATPIGTAGFAIDESRGDVIYTFACDTRHTPATVIFDVLSRLDETARHWREWLTSNASEASNHPDLTNLLRA